MTEPAGTVATHAGAARVPIDESGGLNLAREFAGVAALRPANAIQIVAHHEKAGHERAGHSYEFLTFRRCRELGEQYARGMQASGIKQGDLAVILMKPSLELVPVFLALWHVGAIPLVVDPGASKEQKLKSIEDIGPNVLVGIPLVHALRILHRKAFRTIQRSVTIGGFSPVGGPTLKSFLRLPKRQPNDGSFASAPTMASDTMAIVFTTGSTGTPKGVVYTHANGAAIIEIMKESLGLGPAERCLACHPAFAIYFVGSGATVITPDMDPRYPRDADPACLLDIIREQKPTVAFMQIPVVTNLSNYCALRGEKIPYLRKILTTGASVPIDLVERVQEVLEEPEGDLYVMYGATEALCISYATGRELLAKAPETRDGRGTYLGRPAPGITVEVIGIRNQPIEHWSPDLILGAGEIGEICVFGPVVTPAYHGQPEATRKAKIPDSNGLWHRMGDAGYLDEDGGLWYCGRIADRLATSAGYFYSDLVEPIFNRHPEVNRSALVGVPLAGSSLKRPIVLIEPARNGSGPDPVHEQKLAAQLKQLAAGHPNTRSIDEIVISQDPFPVDVRHGAKIRRDLLTRSLTEGMPVGDKLPADRSILFRGHKVAYYEQGHGEPFLFLHNAGNDHHIWEHQINYFAQKHRVVAADSLGYGRSDKPKLDYSLPLYTEMVSALVESLHLAPVTIVATCTGAAMALNYALANPQKVKRLFLFHIATERTVIGGNLQATVRMVSGRPLMKRILAPLVDAMMSRGMLHRGIIAGQYVASSQEDPAFLDHLHKLYGKKGEGACLINLFSNWSSFASLDRLSPPADLPPVHVFWGEDNKVIPLARGRELCERLQPQSIDVIPSGGHLVMREKPEFINRRIEELAQW
jgi:acyl-CoA synthetase (AMP-forming)/AMP-acid ligase II/pimeloyl-ACP methyl ester carboxylesterase